MTFRSLKGRKTAEMGKERGTVYPCQTTMGLAVPFVLKNSKDVPENIVVKRFEETKATAYGLKKAA